MAQDGLILTEDNCGALEKAREEKRRTGRSNRAPGYFRLARHVNYVGTSEVGRIYQQTFIDTYTKVAFVKLYDRKHAITGGHAQ